MQLCYIDAELKPIITYLLISRSSTKWK